MNHATLNIEQYTMKDLYDVFDMSTTENYTRDYVTKKYNTLVSNIQQETKYDNTFKLDLAHFLRQGWERVCEHINNKKNEKESVGNFFPTLERNQTFNNEHFVIKQNPKPNLTSLLNPYKTEKIGKLVNINTVFRQNYYNSTPTDFVFDLAATLNNVTSISLETAEIPNSNYTFSEFSKTNEFTIELFDKKKADNTIHNQKIEVIKIKSGTYNGMELSDYLNKSIFSHGELARLCCDYDIATKKFKFMKDSRSADKGGKPDDATWEYCFNLDFRLHLNPQREIQKNMGWKLGYRKQYYSFGEDYITKENVTTQSGEGFSPESIFKNNDTPYVFLSLDCYNNNHSQTIMSPFQESAFNDTNILAKLPKKDNSYNYESGGLIYGFKRDYFGPVNISKIKVRLIDHFGEVVDLNNTDYSFTLKVEQLYDLNVKH
mgnify:CR=1 FL=1|tara:strand:- start:716 stop:2008 length:1293 start_codon:yes stop_codon:yes gene_type:complete